MDTQADKSGRNWRLLVGDVLERLAELPDESVHCCVTSPPYYGLRDYGCDGQIGLEASPQEFIDNLVKVFRQVRRVLRHDGTLWLNIGDSYANYGKWGGHSGGKHAYKDGSLLHQPIGRNKRYTGLKPKDLIGIPWMLAFALRADGWYLRSEIIWAKRSPMPESVRDRPTKAHEQIFLLSKSPTYFYDAEAIKEPATGRPPGNKTHKGKTAYQNGDRTKVGLTECTAVESRNARTVWTLSSEPYAGAHFATFPTTIPARAIKAGTSEIGCCPDCGAPWRRKFEKVRVPTRPGENTKVKVPGGWDVGKGSHGTIHREGRTEATYSDRTAETFRESLEVGNRDPQRHVTQTRTVGWEPSCNCRRSREEAVPCVVLEPFAGSGTTIRVALELGRAAIGVELNQEYAVLAEERITAPLEKPAERHEPAEGQKTLFAEGRS